MFKSKNKIKPNSEIIKIYKIVYFNYFFKCLYCFSELVLEISIGESVKNAESQVQERIWEREKEKREWQRVTNAFYSSVNFKYYNCRHEIRSIDPLKTRITIALFKVAKGSIRDRTLINVIIERGCGCDIT